MTKMDRDSEALIDLGEATVETRGAVPINKPDEQLQYLPHTGLSAD